MYTHIYVADVWITSFIVTFITESVYGGHCHIHNSDFISVYLLFSPSTSVNPPPHKSKLSSHLARWSSQTVLVASYPVAHALLTKDVSKWLF